MRSTFWTPERVELFKKLWAEGVSVPDIQERLRATLGQIAGKRYLLNLPLGGKPVKPKKERKPRAKSKPKPKPAVQKVVKPATPVKDSTFSQAIKSTEGPPPDNAVSVLDVQPGQCRWPFGHPKSEDFRFCGQPVRLDQMFCDEHRAVAYRKIERKKR